MPPPTMPVAATPGSTMATATTDDCHILVVEDDPRLRERLARYLSGEGFRVTAAGDAAEART